MLRSVLNIATLIILCGDFLGVLNVRNDFECLHSELGCLVLRMWAGGGHQQPSANAQQWWPMSYNYQYQTQPADASQDWAAKAALWAQQRMAQEQMAQYYQQQPQSQVHHPQLHQQPAYGSYQPDVQVSLGQQPPVGVESQTFNPDVDVPPPPLPPGDSGEPPIPGWQDEDSNHLSDNIETVAMDDEAEQTRTAGTKVNKNPGQDEQHEDRERQATITQDYNHQRPPALPGMQTFDHNHGFSRPPPQQYSHVAPQPIDYGHGHHSLDYGHQGPLVPGAQVYDYQPQFDSHYYHQQPYEMERHHRLSHEHGKPKSHHPVDSVPDLSGLNDVKKKALPMWIREGLEKLEKNKQKKEGQTEEGEQKKAKLNLSGSSSTIAGYDHGKVDSPVHSPKSNESDEESEAEKVSHHQPAGEESDHEVENKSFSDKERRPRKALEENRKVQSSDEEEEVKTEEEKQQESMLNIRKLLTEVLLTVTNEELKKIAQETYNEALRGPARQLQHSGGLDALRGKGGYLGLGGYGSESESDSEQEAGHEKQNADQEEREHLSAGRDDKQQTRRSRSRSHADREYKHSQAEQESEEEESDEKQQSKQRDSSEKRRRKERHRSRSSSVSESSSSVSAHNKSRRKKRRRKERSESSSPKQRRRHRRHHGKRSRSRSRSPRKHSSSSKKKRKSVSESDSDSDSRTSSRHKPSRHSEKKHRRKRRSSSSSSYERDGKRDRKRKT